MTAAENRRLWLAIHRYTGLVMLLFVALAAVTGCVLVLAKPLDAALNPDLFRREASRSQADPLAAARALEAARPELVVTSTPLSAGPRENLLLTVAPRKPGAALPYSQVFLDGGDGHVVGERKVEPGWDRRHLVEGIFEFHYTLLAGKAGRWLMGAMALAWLLSNLVGVYVSFPLKRPFWSNWKRAWEIRIRAPFARLMLDLHQASGLWLLAGITALAFTSVAMNFFDEAFTPTVNAVSPAKASPFDRPPPAAAPPAPDLNLARVVMLGEQRAKAQGLDWKPAAAGYLPEYGLYQVTFTKSGEVNYSRLGPISYYYRAADGAFVYEDNPYADSAGRKLSRALYPVHTGQVAGPIGEAVVFVLGLATAEMCVTGAYLWLKRRGPRVAGRKAMKARKAEKA